MTEVESDTRLTPEQVAAVDALVAKAAAADRVAPLNEEAQLRLHSPDARNVLHLRATRGGSLAGYAVAVGDDPVVLECVVEPGHRRRGVATELARAVLARFDGVEVRAWAHGDLSGSAELAAGTGFEPGRVLLRLEARLVEPLSDAPAPDGITIRPFRPGADDAAWLKLNARAFADHPEQGAMTQDDLDARLAAPWFDPSGFFLAERDDQLLGFHWTKVPEVGGSVGEVYVVGVDPAAQGSGLGLTLTRHGLVHMQRQGVRTVELYVEGDNAAALAVYRRLGFGEAARDVMYLRQA